MHSLSQETFNLFEKGEISKEQLWDIIQSYFEQVNREDSVEYNPWFLERKLIERDSNFLNKEMDSIPLEHRVRFYEENLKQASSKKLSALLNIPVPWSTTETIIKHKQEKYESDFKQWKIPARQFILSPDTIWYSSRKDTTTYLSDWSWSQPRSWSQKPTLSYYDHRIDPYGQYGLRYGKFYKDNSTGNV